MSKLFKLKKWMPLNDAMHHITNAVGEIVDAAEIFRLALDGHLTLSVDFVNGAYGRKAEIVKAEDVEFLPPESVSNFDCVEDQVEIMVPTDGEDRINDYEWLRLSSEIVTLDGVWDLPMKGAERLYIERKYQELTDGPSVTTAILCGVLVQRGDDLYSVHEKFIECESSALSIAINNKIEAEDLIEEEAMKLRIRIAERRKAKLAKSIPELVYYSKAKLPDDAVLVISTNEITRFVQLLEDEPESEPERKPTEGKPLRSKERNTLLTLLGAMCKQLDIDPSARGSSTSIQKMTEEIGAPIGEDTIRKVLKSIDDAVEARTQ